MRGHLHMRRRATVACPRVSAQSEGWRGCPQQSGHTPAAPGRRSLDGGDFSARFREDAHQLQSGRCAAAAQGPAMIEPIIRVKDIAWIRLRSPDLDLAEQFLRDFGLLPAERTANALYMRGTDPVHHIHITEKGDPKVKRIAFWARSEEDLYKLSRQAAGASPVESLDEPGGGRRVRLAEHNGMGLEVVWGVADVPALPVQTNTLNFGHAKYARAGELLR